MRTGIVLVTVLAAALALPTTQARAAACSGMDAKIGAAKTAADHEAIAACYDDMAKEAHANADAHRHMDSYYNEPGYKSSKLGAQRHCRALVASYEAAAKDAEGLAKIHRDMAKKVK
jgi:hypothetical protein